MIMIFRVVKWKAVFGGPTKGLRNERAWLTMLFDLSIQVIHPFYFVKLDGEKKYKIYILM